MRYEQVVHNDLFQNCRTLAHVYDNTSATYKFYWFISILDILAREGKTKLSFWEIIAGMISESWYPIHYFRISFGKSDSIFQQSLALKDKLGISKDADKDFIKKTILENLHEREIKKAVSIFTLNVPYRFLHPWIPTSDNKEMELRSQSFENDCLYAIKGKTITINPKWTNYLKDNYQMLRDFSFWNLNVFLQRRNPNVPDMPSKLVKPIQRESLQQQRKLWNLFLREQGGFNCIYTNIPIQDSSYDLDHFIPWSFVSHNQMWNLLPADSSINSSKSDRLPDLDRFLAPFTQIQHKFLKFIYGLRPNEKLLEDYLVIDDSISELSAMDNDDFFCAFKRIISPLEQIASNMGFLYW